MFEYHYGNILESQCEALVNPVNCAGVAGAGLALQFKQRFPDSYWRYRDACHRKLVKLGRVHVTSTGLATNPLYVINFPTKWRWHDNSRLMDVVSGLVDLRRVSVMLGLRSIAIPAIGCGLGKLDWEVVRGHFKKILDPIEDVHIEVYPPQEKS